MAKLTDEMKSEIEAILDEREARARAKLDAEQLEREAAAEKAEADAEAARFAGHFYAAIENCTLRVLGGMKDCRKGGVKDATLIHTDTPLPARLINTHFRELSRDEIAGLGCEHVIADEKE